MNQLVLLEEEEETNLETNEFLGEDYELEPWEIFDMSYEVWQENME